MPVRSLSFGQSLRQNPFDSFSTKGTNREHNIRPSEFMRTSAGLPIVEKLRERIQRLEGTAARRRLMLPFGIKAIDRHLPGGGLALGALHEVAGGGHGAIDGAAAALFAAGIAARTRGKVLWCITCPDLFAPALAQAGLMPDPRDLCR